MSDLQEIRIGIIGTGIIAHHHVQKHNALQNVKVVAACDLNQKKLDDFCSKYKIENKTLDYRELLQRDDLDAVDVCLHNNLHAPISIAVMASGKNCYCEKPMAGSYTDALAMKKAADIYGVKLHIQLAQIYGGPVIAAKKLIDGGYLGRIYHARSYGFRRRGRPFVDGYAEKEFDSQYWAGHGALFDMGVYHISQLLYLLNTPKVDRVSGSIYQELDMHAGRRNESGFNVEELGLGLVKFTSGLTMDIIESWAIHAGNFPLSSIHGSKGGLQFERSAHVHGQLMHQLKYFSEIEGYPAETVLDVSAEDYRQFNVDPTREFYEDSQVHWVAALRGLCPQIDTPHLALQTMLISEGIFLSGQLGREVTADEIESLSRSNAIQEQDTSFGRLTYLKYPFISE